MHKRVAANSVSANQLAVVAGEATYCLTIGETPSPPTSTLLSSWLRMSHYKHTYNVYYSHHRMVALVLAELLSLPGRPDFTS